MTDAVLANAVEHDDRVVNRETNHGQECRDEQRIDLDVNQAPENREDAKDDKGVVQ